MARVSAIADLMMQQGVQQLPLVRKDTKCVIRQPPGAGDGPQMLGRQQLAAGKAQRLRMQLDRKEPPWLSHLRQVMIGRGKIVAAGIADRPQRLDRRRSILWPHQNIEITHPAGFAPRRATVRKIAGALDEQRDDLAQIERRQDLRQLLAQLVAAREMLRIGCLEPAADMTIDVRPADRPRQRQQQRALLELEDERRKHAVRAGEIHQDLPGKITTEQSRSQRTRVLQRVIDPQYLAQQRQAAFARNGGWQEFQRKRSEIRFGRRSNPNRQNSSLAHLSPTFGRHGPAP